MKLIVFVLLLAVFLAGCAAGPNTLANTPDVAGDIAGFWMGVWHGIIFPITFIVHLFSDGVHFYETHNNGGWYNFGFFLGIGALTSSSTASSSRSR